MLRNAYLGAKIGFDTAANELSKVGCGDAAGIPAGIPEGFRDSRAGLALPDCVPAGKKIGTGDFHFEDLQICLQHSGHFSRVFVQVLTDSAKCAFAR